MSAPTGVTPFVDVTNCSYNSNSIFGVKRITVERRREYVYSKDNNKLRYVASHEVFNDDTVTIESTDLNALIALQASTGIHDLTFNAVVSSQNVASNTLATQAVTLKNVCWSDQRDGYEMKGEGSFVITGRIIGVADNSDPITYAAAT